MKNEKMNGLLAGVASDRFHCGRVLLGRNAFSRVTESVVDSKFALCTYYFCEGKVTEIFNRN